MPALLTRMSIRAVFCNEGGARIDIGDVERIGAGRKALLAERLGEGGDLVAAACHDDRPDAPAWASAQAAARPMPAVRRRSRGHVFHRGRREGVRGSGSM